MLDFGLIGYGAIGESLIKAAFAGEAGSCRPVVVLEIPNFVEATRAKVRRQGWDLPVTSDPEEFFAVPSGLIVECAGHAALKAYAVRSLESGRDLLAVSVGAFVDEELLYDVMQAADHLGRRVSVPSGAMLGLDGISAAAVGRIDEVTITTRKPPAAWKGTSAEQTVNLETVTEPVCVYEGPAREAVRLFPQNVNVAAAVSLAGVGLDRTSIRVFVDPTITRNTHEVRLRGEFGELGVYVQSLPSPTNPKTGLLTLMSVTRAMRNLTSSFIIGI